MTENYIQFRYDDVTGIVLKKNDQGVYLLFVEGKRRIGIPIFGNNLKRLIAFIEELKNEVQK